ncbi:MAG: hypothetical protein GXO64_04475, partial [Candidatus Micrarchaeota archaeon]|nr:hypothetical protein [Candidatus Micrarchaeota archaeon]
AVDLESDGTNDIEYLYDYGGHLVQKNVGGQKTNFVYDIAGNLIYEDNDVGSSNPQPTPKKNKNNQQNVGGGNPLTNTWDSFVNFITRLFGFV